MLWPNYTLLRTAAGRHVCNRLVLSPPSLSFIR